MKALGKSSFGDNGKSTRKGSRVQGYVEFRMTVLTHSLGALKTFLHANH